MSSEIDMEGKDQMVYGDVFSGGTPVETDISDLLNPTQDASFGPQLPAQPPIETIET